jgi:hypothetical protein
MALSHIPFGSACRNDVFDNLVSLNPDAQALGLHRACCAVATEPGRDAPVAQWADSRISLRRSSSGNARGPLVGHHAASRVSEHGGELPFVTLKPGMGCQVRDHAEPHRSYTAIGAKLFIVD